MSQSAAQISQAVKRRLAELKSEFVQRDEALDLIMLAFCCREHLLLIGPTGTGRSQLVARVAASLGLDIFQYSIQHNTAPNEISTTAKILFLEEAFSASSSVINRLLDLLRREGTRTICVALSDLPEDPGLQAVADRFELRLVLEPAPESSLEQLLQKSWFLESHTELPTQEVMFTAANLELFYKSLGAVDMSEVLSVYIELINKLRLEGVTLSDRRVGKGFKCIRAAALLEGRGSARPRDFWPLLYFWSDPNDIELIREQVRPLLEEDGGVTIPTPRSLEDLRENLETLNSGDRRDSGELRSRLITLGQLRRELISSYPGATELMLRIEIALEQALAELALAGERSALN